MIIYCFSYTLAALFKKRTVPLTRSVPKRIQSLVCHSPWFAEQVKSREAGFSQQRVRIANVRINSICQQKNKITKMTFFYSNNQLPRKTNAKMDSVILYYHLKIRQKNKKLLFTYSFAWDFLCVSFLQWVFLTLWVAKADSIKILGTIMECQEVCPSP